MDILSLDLPAEWLLVPAVLVVFHYWRVFRTIFNPASLFVASLASTVFFAHLVDFLSGSFEIWGYFRADPAPVTLLYAFGIACFLAPWFLIPKRIGFFDERMSDRPYVDDFSRIRQVSSVFALFLLASLLLTFFELGGIPVINMFAGNYSHFEHVEYLKQLPLGLMAFNLAMTFALILYVASFIANPGKYGVSGRYITALVLVLIVSASWQGNRQIFLMLLFFVFARRLVDQRPEVISIIRMFRSAFITLAIVVAFATMFTIIGVMRLRSAGGGDPFDALTYFAWPVYNMTEILMKLGPDDDYVPHYILSELLPARFGGRERVAELGDYVFEPSSPSGYFAYWYLDFGYSGVAAGGLILGLFSRWAFTHRLRNENAMRVYLLSLWCCATAGIYCHFLSINYFIVPFLLQFIQSPLFGHRRYGDSSAAKRSAPGPAPGRIVPEAILSEGIDAARPR